MYQDREDSEHGILVLHSSRIRRAELFQLLIGVHLLLLVVLSGFISTFLFVFVGNYGTEGPSMLGVVAHLMESYCIPGRVGF